jgi:predicted enzyme related to lactoylglutathione lyase
MLSLDTQAVVVRDAKKAAKFWTEKVGLEQRANYDHWVTVAPKGSKFEIHLCETTPLERGNTGIGFSAKDVAAEEKRLRGKGVKVTMKTTKKPWGTIMQFADPDGNRYWVSEG